MFSGDLRFATEDFYDISHKGGDRDAYMDGFLLENTSWHDHSGSSRVAMKLKSDYLGNRLWARKAASVIHLQMRLYSGTFFSMLVLRIIPRQLHLYMHFSYI